jgi:hypothetical protein
LSIHINARITLVASQPSISRVNSEVGTWTIPRYVKVPALLTQGRSDCPWTAHQIILVELDDQEACIGRHAGWLQRYVWHYRYFEQAPRRILALHGKSISIIHSFTLTNSCVVLRSGHSKRFYGKSTANKTLSERKRKLTGYLSYTSFPRRQNTFQSKKNCGTPSLIGYKVANTSYFLHRGQATEHITSYVVSPSPPPPSSSPAS